ncbi:MAG: ABC transporter permease [Chloroflexi bacterium]|nr:ABC transporter permease [Chloroflexota bacterium]
MDHALRRAALAQPIPSISPVRRTYRFIRRWPLFPVAILATILVCAVFAPLIAPHDPVRGKLIDSNIPPPWYEKGTADHLLGTDPLGRDILSRIIFGARVSMIVASIVLLVGAVLGTALGLLAGFFGRQIDEVIMRTADFTFAVPFLLVALVVVIVLGPSISVIVALLTVFAWAGFARQVRGETLQIRTRDYVSLARVAGASSLRIMYRHILPGVLNTVLVIATLRVGGLILAEASLSFLGVGVPPPTPAWGSMVADGRAFIDTAWWVAFFPGLAIMLTVVAFNFIGDWLRDWYDPRLRQL